MGTMKLLEKENIEKTRQINTQTGQIALLNDGVNQLEKRVLKISDDY